MPYHLFSEPKAYIYPIVLTLIILLLGYAAYRYALPKPIPGVPYHHLSAASLLGDVPAMVRHSKEHGTIMDWMTAQGAQINSPIYQLFIRPLSKPDVFLTDPREIQDILLRRAKEFDRSQFFMDAFVGTVPHHHIVQPTGEKFRQGRRFLAAAMSPSFLSNVAAPSVHKHLLNLMKLWRIKNGIAAGHAFWAADDLNHMALDSIWDVAFGGQLGSLASEIHYLKRVVWFLKPPKSADEAITLPKPEYNAAVRSMKCITHALDLAVTSPLPRQAHWVLRWTPAYRRALAYKEKLVRECLANAQARLASHHHKGEEGGDLAGVTCATDLMVRREAQVAARESRAPCFDSDMAKDELFGFLVGGHDTTSTTLMWSVKLAADNPGPQARLRAALYAALPGSDADVPAPSDIAQAQIPYLDAFVEEVVRCAQTSGVTVRKALCDTTLLGHQIPRGTDVYCMSNGPGFMAPNGVNDTIAENTRSPSSRESKEAAGGFALWDPTDVATFRPERWIKTNDHGRETFDSHAGPVVQFGGGLRGCFGKKLAYLEIKMFITIMLWTFELIQVPEKLRGYEALDCLTHKPKKCYLILKETGKVKRRSRNHKEDGHC